MNNWKVISTIILATVLIFSAGVFTGGILVTCVKQPHPHPAAVKKAANTPTNSVAVASPTTNAPAKPPRAPEILSKDFLQRLDADLHLTKDQHDAVQKIIEDGQNSVRKAVQDARLEIREALTPEQRTQFDELVKRPFHKPIFATNAPPVLPATNSAPAKTP